MEVTWFSGCLMPVLVSNIVELKWCGYSTLPLVLDHECCYHPFSSVLFWSHLPVIFNFPNIVVLVEHGYLITADPLLCHQFNSVQLLSRVRLFATPWITARQASLSITNSLSSLRLTSIESVMPSSHLILCHPLLLLPPIPPSIRVFSNESTLCMRWLKYCSFSFSIIPSKEIPGLIFRMDWLISLQSKGLSRVFSNTTVQKHQFFSVFNWNNCLHVLN